MRIGRLTRAPLLLLAVGFSIAAFSLTFTHLAGSFGGPGFEDGNGTAARFKSDAGVAVDGSGNVYVADTSNHTIRKISSSGEVTTLAGLAETSGSTNGRGAHALLNSPNGVAVDGSGNVYVADTLNHAIRKITASGVVSTLAGQPGSFGFTNANGSLARFYAPRGVAVDGSGNVYVADTFNHAIRKITPSGDVTTVAGTGSAGNVNDVGTNASFNTPSGLAYDATTTSLFVADTGNTVIRQITLPGLLVTTFAGTMNTPGHQDAIPGRFYAPRGIGVDGSGALYVADSTDYTIRSVTSGGTVGTVAGLAFYPGPDDGTNAGARFNKPAGVAVNGSTLYVADTGNHTVRKIAVGGSNVVSTFAGLANASGNTNATGSAARFNNPTGLAYYPGSASGFAYVADTGNHSIRRVGMNGVTTLLAGAGAPGYQNGTGGAAQFRLPRGLALRWADSGVYVADTGNNCIRLVTSGGVASLFAGQPGAVGGYAEGDRITTAAFNAPQGVALSGTALYVADTLNYRVRKIDLSSGVVSTLAGSGSFGTTNANGTSASFGIMTGIMCDSGENVYVAESATYTIRKIAPNGDVTTLAGSFGFGAVDGTGTAAHFGYPGPTMISGDQYSGNAFVADPQANLIRTITLSGGVVGTAGGRNGVSGTSDGTGTFARFNGAANIAASFGQTMVISEGHTIRFGGAEIADRATIDSATGLVGASRQLDMSPQTATSWTWSVIRRPAGSTATLSATNVRNPTFVPDVPDLYVFRCIATSNAGSSISTVSLQGNGATTSLSIGYPGPQTVGVPFRITVAARDADGNIADGYSGTVHFTSSDPTATLPSDYTFLSADHGVHAFDVTMLRSFEAFGCSTILATDTVTSSITGGTDACPHAAAAASLSVSIASLVGSGNPVNVTVTPKDSYGNIAYGYTGTIHFTSSDGAATLPSDYTFTAGSVPHTFALGVTLRTFGMQSVTATDTVTGSITGFANVTVGPTIPGSFTANGTASQVILAWNPSSGADHYDIWRAAAGTGGFVPLASTGASFYLDNAVSGGAVYVYKVRSVDSGANASPFSLPDAATTIVFTDDPLVAGATIVKAVHLTELRQAANAFRAAVGLGAATFTDPVLGGVMCKAIHVQEIRTAINDARAAAGMTGSLFVTDATPTANVTPIKAVHLQELRTAMK